MATLTNMNLIGVPHASELISGIGVGFNCFTGKQMTNALAANPTIQNLGTNSQSFFKICYSAEDFNNTVTNSLGVSAQISLKKASNNSSSSSDSSSGSDSGSGSGSDSSSDSSSTFSDPSVSSTLSLSNALSINDTSVSVIVYARVENIHQALSQCQLNSSITVPTTQSECLNFYQQYGDSFVSELTEGAEYVAVFVFSCQTKEDQRSLQEALTAQVTVNVCQHISPTLGANLTAGLTETLNNTTVRCQIYQSLVGSNASLPTLSSVSQFVANIVSTAQNLNANTPVVFDFAVTGYETLFGSSLSASFINIANNRQIYLDCIAPTLTSLGHLASKYQWITTAYQAYKYSGDTTFSTKQNQLNSDISNVNSWISNIAAKPTQTPNIASSINPPPSLMNGIPVFNYLVPTQPLYGDTSNEPFQDINVGSEVTNSSSTITGTTKLTAGINGSIYGHGTPTASGTYSQTTSKTTGIAVAISNIPVLYMITVWGNNNVANFYASYNTIMDCSFPFGHGAANVSSCSGETLFLTTTNQNDGVDSLDNQVYIDKMSGQVSNGVITQLSFTDSASYSITQPTSASGSSFSWSLPAAATLIGFQGYCNSSNLLGLQPICIIVQPAKWLAPSIETQPFVNTLPVSTLGVGYNSFLGSALPNSALNSSACTSVDQGAQSEVIMKICASRQSLSETLSKTRGFSIGIPGFKLSHTKTKTKTIQVTDTDVTLVLITRVVTSSPVYTRCSLSPTLANLTTEQLFTEYGDSFVCATVNGGMYVAVFVFQCDSSAVQETVQKTLSASASIKSASLDASLSSDVSNAQSSKGVNLTCYQQVIGSSSFSLPSMTGNAETDAEALVQTASQFSASHVDTPWLLSFTTMGYEGLLPASALSSFQPIVTNRQTYQLQVAPTLTQLYGIWSEIENILQIYTTYNYYADPNIGFPIRGQQQMVYNAIQELTAWLTDVAANPQQAATSPTDGSCDPLDIIAKGTPSLNYSITITPCNSSSNRLSPLWGNNNSVSFQDICAGQPFFNSNTAFNSSHPANSTPTPLCLKDLPKIAAVQLHGGDYVDQLSTIYSYQAGAQTFSHGGSGGGPCFNLNLAVDEFISSVSGTCGDYINQLTLQTTSSQDYTFPLSPSSTGNTISWTAADNQVLLGFQGSSGDYLNQLQLIVLSLSPSTWAAPLVDDLSSPLPCLPITTVGIGFNSFSNSAMPNGALDLSSLTIGDQNATGKQWYQVCSSGESLSKTLKYAIGGGADGDSLHRKVTHTAKVSNLSVTVVIYASHEKTSPIINGTPQLSSSAQSLFSSSPTQFYSAYGDSYVSSAVLGMEYIALFVFECSTVSEQQSVLNSLSAQAVVPSDPPITLSANLAKNITQAVSSLTLDFYAYQVIRGSDTPLPNPFNSTGSSSSSSSSSQGAALLMKVLNPEISKLSLPYATSSTSTSDPANSVTVTNVIQSLLAFANGLSANNVTGSGIALSYTTVGYETLVSETSNWQFLASNRPNADAINSYLGALATINNQMQIVDDLYQRYNYTGDSTFAANCGQLKSDYQALRSQQISLFQNPFTASSYPTQPQSITNGVPTANWSIVTGPIWGNDASAHFWDINSSIAIGCETINGSTVTTATSSNNSSNPTPLPLSQLPLLISVSIWGGDYVNQIGTTYQSLGGTQQFTHGQATVNAWPALNLSKGEFITEITVIYGDYVNAVQFSTNYGQTSLLAPASCDSASVATWSVPGNCTLIGFQGSSGDYLNQLQPVCLSFSPASWSSVSVSVDEILFPYTQCIAAMTFRSIEGVTNELDNYNFFVSAYQSGISVGQFSPNPTPPDYVLQVVSNLDNNGSGTTALEFLSDQSNPEFPPPYYFVSGSYAGNIWLNSITPATTGQFTSSNVTTQIAGQSEPDAAIAGLFYYAVTSYLYVAASNGNLYWYSVGWANGVPSLSYVGSNTSYTAEAPVSLTFFPAKTLTDYDCLLLGGCAATGVVFNAENPSSTPTLYGYHGGCNATDVCKGPEGIYWATPAGGLHYQPYSGFNASLAPIWTVPSGQVILSLAYSPNAGNADPGNYPDGAIFIATAPSNPSNYSMGSIWICDVSNNTVSNAAQQDATISGSPWAIIADANLNYMCATGSGGVFLSGLCGVSLSTYAADSPNSTPENGMLVLNVEYPTAGYYWDTTLVSGAALDFIPMRF
ncbi:conserved hypothetical protein [Microcystis aeruginosa PCC 9807]|uniref:Jacalin-type lectin domain-containing protein n=1 Tax=Microcystis aeruginosa PCC 9807 TaxID=1160283 RepID=I4HBW8_MICAE|nr:jacalin-like lectin [Microcystis aeruginosa]CCI19542.1 conserved hypothetical protein [Microcystis aeruginosa PCC 9807]